MLTQRRNRRRSLRPVGRLFAGSWWAARALYPRLRLGPTAQHPAATVLLVPPLPLAAYLLRRWPVTTDTRRPS